MISLLIKDKNGVVVENGDMIKLVSIKPEYQEEFDPFFSFQNDTTVEWNYIIVDPQDEYDNTGYFGISLHNNFSKENLLDLFGLPSNCSEEEFKECVYDVVCESLNIEPIDIDNFYQTINEFEVIGNTFKNPDLIEEFK